MDISGKIYSMKTIRKITEELVEYNDWESTETILKEWANSIISECADQAIDDNTECRILSLIDNL